MKLRQLERKDAELMLEWMHDPSVVKDLQTDFSAKTLSDCLAFIDKSQAAADQLKLFATAQIINFETDINLAIVDDNDEYMGTVSLKHANYRNAEFAITVRKAAMGKGFSKFATDEIIRIGREELGLEEIYWCVDPVNERAVRFYDKNGFKRVDFDTASFKPQAIKHYTKEQAHRYIWYVGEKND